MPKIKELRFWRCHFLFVLLWLQDGIEPTTRPTRRAQELTHSDVLQDDILFAVAEQIPKTSGHARLTLWSLDCWLLDFHVPCAGREAVPKASFAPIKILVQTWKHTSQNMDLLEKKKVKQNLHFTSAFPPIFGCKQRPHLYAFFVSLLLLLHCLSLITNLYCVQLVGYVLVTNCEKKMILSPPPPLQTKTLVVQCKAPPSPFPTFDPTGTGRKDPPDMVSLPATLLCCLFQVSQEKAQST